MTRQDAFLQDGFLARGLAWAYDDGEVLPPHTHSWAQLVYAQSGVMQVETAEAAWLVPTTRAIWIPADVGHSIRMRGDVAMRSLYIAEPGNAWPATCQALEVTALLREVILYMVEERWFEPDDARHIRLVGLLADLIAQCRDVPLVLPMPTDPRARVMAERILKHPGAIAPLEQLAEGTGASLRTLQRVFRAQTGVPLAFWRLRARMHQAVVLLSAGEPVTAVALAAGFKSPSAFTSAFKRTFGVTPSRYR